ncbi:protein-N(pi)-phosphohistidine--D-fructose phosphotransferase OS=Tsukamurella paurometabola (strain ATCC 8368 / DSM / CCUG 35730 / CIP 100753 / JCM 10117/ KCTC 9821 / NBRC 16120 / NCIMB 702349 / NCTC 13040) OX=521096 GN=Tpau_0186 PE=4 SV=1 [Tsukamurella paurometabola]|uniref:PTS system, fructose subfamily, IIC subunit n=1 Tax=Tsukamurella paurometabola (strain ATCC 8368 / DSM 20162 / CCUG 35730 / CIP 100753 / JCM 10117 / KCTC 9821 / NBRC 16120 / NCIMB 702349 / NCTC 13040) TaxID=521096 RepID=D5UQK7_TSUPD|nr:fructose-specific PTS transporter subunit EIIC [Tsukamurella paurometabola]ADG76840.1 PTS system, fructose subfamily, IIC subunit [Tsukamurella paurometabola DSM 20162]SUP41862.1 EIIABC-Fru [Tsukamurella paurometabola]
MTEPIITPELVALDIAAGTEKSEVIGYLAHRIAEAGRAHAVDALIEAALAREGQSATGLPGGIAIPHCRTASVTAASLAFARLDPRVDFGAPDGPADLVFLIAARESGGSQHMKLLSALARALVRPEFVASLRTASTPEEVVALVDEVITPASPAPKPAPADPPAAPPAKRPAVIAITACPTGIAHTYMAADALKLAAERAGVDLTVETQGSSGSSPLSAQTIAEAGAVIFATDVGVKGRERFAGKPVVTSGVKRGINEPDAMIAEAVAAASDPRAAIVDGDAATTAESAPAHAGLGGELKRALLTGVSYMIPFVAAGGLLMALGFLMAGYEIGSEHGSDGVSNGAYFALHNSLWNLPDGGMLQYLGGVSFAIGQAAMTLMVPVLAGYIAYAIADRPGLAPGFVAGVLAGTVGAGFIGGVVGGLLAGVVALWLSRIPLPQWARGLQPVVIIPLLGTLITGGLMYMVLAGPLRWVNESMTSALNGMSGSSKIALGAVLGLMMCFDLGGPVNKAAYAFGVAGIGLSTAGVPQWEIMAAVMAAGMVPPLALALATFVRPGLFTEPERENGKAALPLGLCFISEGAIPFAAADPLRVIPTMMLGGAVTGGLSMALSAQLRAPHGGVFVMFATNGTWWKFLVALAVGVIVSAAAVVTAKAVWRRDAPVESPQPAAVAA